MEFVFDHSDFEFNLIRRDLVLKTFRNKFRYLNHFIIISRDINFYTRGKSLLLVSPGYNLCSKIITTSTDLLGKSEEILKDRHSRLLGS